MGGSLVQASPGKIAGRAGEREIRALGNGTGRERAHQGLDGLRLPVQGQAERMVCEQPRRAGPVTRGLSMPDGVSDLAVPDQPLRGEPVQGRQFFGEPAAQLQAEQVSEEVVIPEPGPGRIERYDKRVGVFEIEEDTFGAGVTSQQIRQLTVDPVEQGSAQEKLLDPGRLAFQHFGEQVLGYRAAAARELRDKPLPVRAARQRHRRQPQAGRPAFGALVQPGHPGLRQRDTRSLQELAGLALSETQVCRADVCQVTGETELVQPQGEIAPRRQDRVHVLGELLQQPGQLRQRFCRGQLVEIIDDEESAVVMRGEFGQDSLADGRFIEVGCRCQLFAVAGTAGGLPDGAEDGQPELLGVLLIAPHLDDCQPVPLTRTICPGPEQGSLAAARRGGDKCYLRCRRVIEGRKKLSALNQPRSCLGWLWRVCPKRHA